MSSTSILMSRRARRCSLSFAFVVLAQAGVACHAAEPSNSLGQEFAARMEKMVSGMKETAYQGATEINEDTGSLKCDCSGLMGHVLRQHFPEAYLSVRGMEGQDRRRPLAVTYYETFAAAGEGKGNGRWMEVKNIMEVQPGDLLGWRKDTIEQGQSTGHVGMVASAPIVEKDGRVRLRILDSTRGPHSNDTRTEATLGVGSGDMFFTVDRSGKATGFYVRDEGPLSTNAFAFGRMVNLGEQASKVADVPGDADFEGLDLKAAVALAAKRKIQTRVISEDGRITPVVMGHTLGRINFVVLGGKVIRALRG